MRLLVLALALFTPAAAAAQSFPAPAEGDFIVRNFTFASGETLPEVTLRYRTIGVPRKDAGGVVRNGILILHGTGGSGRGFLSETFGGGLFGKGQAIWGEHAGPFLATVRQ
ncbi:MAG TPA: hypothetical protein VMO26_05980 [Vicinamibacterales bacterium]|nr:hypothetical protein [Vicinamibacterales bacterium]